MFTTHDTLHQELTTTGIYSGLYTALMASTPPLAVRTQANQTTGLEFFEQSPRVRNGPIRGTITFNPDTGAIKMAADGYSGPRWHTALKRLTTPTTTWAWQPATDHKPGTIEGLLYLGTEITAETYIGHSRHDSDTADAALTLTPVDRAVCHPTWALAVTVLGTLVTEDPTYRSPVLPALNPGTFASPVTDYPAAIATVAEALALLDENGDFDTARDDDPNWPIHAEGKAVRALRDFRDALIHATPAHQSEQPDLENDAAYRGGCCTCPHEMEA
ncbi:hypothetical protein [Streptomyces parvus]|uniref:hypothetical protein n=1 Tax=Streptomyces parvus TaxID=66428 RepID=UPI002100CE61|nr:hypothetical protein [Streptomyces parvus]MCQ1577238.1 hypothetical protein [Streptomyces parvus]